MPDNRSYRLSFKEQKGKARTGDQYGSGLICRLEYGKE